MTVFTIPRGQVRALWASLLPHAGKQSDDTPEFGRIRHAPGTTDLVAWTFDGVTAAAGYVDVIDHHDDEAEVFDLSTSVVKAALAVFTGPKDADARQMWEDRPLQVTVTPAGVDLLEVEDIVEGRQLTIERLLTSGDDRYPDVPRTLTSPVLDALVPEARVSADALARFVASAKAWGGELVLTVTESRVEVRIGRRLFGLVPKRSGDVDDAGVELARAQGRWAELLTPLIRLAQPDHTGAAGTSPWIRKLN